MIPHSLRYEPAAAGERGRGAAGLHGDAHRTEAGERGDDLRHVEHDRGGRRRAQARCVCEVAAGRDAAGDSAGREAHGRGDAGARGEQREPDGGNREARVANPPPVRSGSSLV